MAALGLDAHFNDAYAELLRIARTRFSHASGTLDTVALVSEAYLKMHRGELQAYADGQHVRATACHAMRQIVCNYLRYKKEDRRNGERVAFAPDEVAAPVVIGPDDLLDLDQALDRLGDVSPRQLSVVEMRFFGGFTMDEIADALGVGVATAQRDWKMATLFLRHLLPPTPSLLLS